MHLDHLCHLLAATINIAFAEKIGGSCILFEDTNPSKVKLIYVDVFLQTFQKLSLKFAKVTYTSDLFPILLEYLNQLIKEGHVDVDVDVDKSSKEEIGRQREIKEASPWRDQSIEENFR